MLFDFDLTVPAGTPANSPVETLAVLTRGKLKRIRVSFPPGPATLVHVVARHNLHQLVPANFDGTLNYDDISVITELDYDLVDAPYEIRMIGWSPTAVYQHIITFGFDLEPVTGDTWETFNRALFTLNNDIRQRS
jgi:hypothetical protein